MTGNEKFLRQWQYGHTARRWHVRVRANWIHWFDTNFTIVPLQGRHIHMYKSKKCLRNYYVKLSNVRSCNQNVIEIIKCNFLYTSNVSHSGYYQHFCKQGFQFWSTGIWSKIITTKIRTTKRKSFHPGHMFVKYQNLKKKKKEKRNPVSFSWKYSHNSAPISSTSSAAWCAAAESVKSDVASHVRKQLKGIIKSGDASWVIILN